MVCLDALTTYMYVNMHVGTQNDSFDLFLRLVAALQDVARHYNVPAENASVPLVETDFISIDVVEVRRNEFAGVSFYESTSTSNGEKFERTASQAFTGGTKDKRDLNVGIELPDSLLEHIGGLEPESTARVNFVTYQTNSFFTDRSLAGGGSRVDNNTKVISAFVGNTSVYNLTNLVTVVFTPLQVVVCLSIPGLLDVLSTYLFYL